MRFNGVDPRTLHRGISIAKEIAPGAPPSDIQTLSGVSGEVPAGRVIMQGEYIVRINVAGKTRAQAWEMRKLLASWACAADAVTHELIPTHWPTVAYDAMFKEISEPEFSFGFGQLDVVFTIPRPFAHDLQWSIAHSTQSTGLMIGGTHNARMDVELIAAGSDGLTLTMDDEVVARLSGVFEAGQVIHINAIDRSVIVDNAHAENRIIYTNTSFARLEELSTPGRHTLTCAESVSTTARWRNEWV